MKKFLALILALIMCLSLVACGGGSDDAASNEDFHIDIKFSNVFQPEEMNGQASEKLAAMITERTGGAVTVTYYGQNQLDCYGDSVAQANMGANWMGLEEPSLFADYVGDCATLIGPMLYNSNEEYNYVMDSDIVADIKARLAEENIHVLDTHYSFGFRSVCTNRDVTKPEDLYGVKLRATSSPLFAKTLEALGATPTPMSFTECLPAITAGVVEGFEGSTSTLRGAGNPYELVKKVALTNHLIATRWLFMPEDLYQSIPEKWRNIIDECAVECGKWEQETCAAAEAEEIAFMAEHGVTWNEVDLDAFTAACAPVYDWIVEEYGADPELKDKLVKLVQDFRASKQ